MPLNSQIQVWALEILVFLLRDDVGNQLCTWSFYLLIAGLAICVCFCWKKWRRFSYIALGLLAFGIVYRWWYFEFDSTRWLATDWAGRYPMVNNLVDKGLLIGKSRSQIVQLLGEPYRPVYFRYVVLDLEAELLKSAQERNPRVSFESDSQNRMLYLLYDGAKTKFGEKVYSQMRIYLNNQQRGNFVDLRYAGYDKDCGSYLRPVDRFP